MRSKRMSPEVSTKQLQFGEEQIALLEKLCNASAVSGVEKEVRVIVQEALDGIADEVIVDTLGNLLVTRKARQKNALRVMLAAHMDEVGFILTSDEKDGLFRFETVGGIDVRQLVGKAVLVGEKNIPGVIGTTPIHLLENNELERKVPLSSLRIDMGPGGADKAKAGDRAVFATRFKQAGPSVMAKALDDRVGVATLIELVKNAPPNIEMLAAFTVQEEVGLRGARAAGYSMNPDMAVVVDCTPANDLPHWENDVENTRYNTRLGSGPAVYIADRATLSDPRLIRWLVDTAEENQIPYQFRQPGSGGTDAGAIHLQREGVPSVSVSVPARNVHSPIMVARLSDWQNMLTLLYTALLRATPELLKIDNRSIA
jgi:tetrahedral aminopeptidase